MDLKPINSLFEILRNKLFLVFAFMLGLVDMMYTVAFTFDSGVYFSYLRILDGDLPWSAWDPFRGFVMPFFIKFDTLLFGRSSTALLILMTLCHLLLFLAITWLVLQAIQPKTPAGQNWLIGLVFIFIAMDPLIIGYYHVILTEFLSSILAISACLLAFVLVKRAESGGKLMVIFLLFSLLAVLAWHLKQPYIGTALFPLLLGSLLILVKNWSRSNFLKIIAGNLLVILITFASILAWKNFLPTYDGPAPQYGDVSSWSDRATKINLDLWAYSPKAFLRNYVDNYLTLSNVYNWEVEKFVYEGKFVIDRTFSLTRARENHSMGYRIYRKGGSNLELIPDYNLEKVLPYASMYAPPVLLTRYLDWTTGKSNFLFSSLYLSLPFTFLIMSLVVLYKKPLTNCLSITFICSGAALLNALEHSFFFLPADRYLFWGYPLILTCSLLFLIFLFKSLSGKLLKDRIKDH
jgi:hypothetical protein